MSNERVVLNEKALTMGLYPQNPIPQNFDPKPYKEAIASVEMAAWEALIEANKKKEEKESRPTFFDAYGNITSPGEAPNIIIPRVGYMPGNEDDEEGLSSGIKETWKYIKEDIPSHYNPIHKPWENTKGLVWNRFLEYVLGTIEDSVRPQNENLANLIKGPRMTSEKNARYRAIDLSPLLGRIIAGYSPGKSYIEHIWVYNKEYKGTTRKVPVFFDTFNNHVTPTEDKLKETIEYVDSNLASPYDNMDTSVSADLVNNPFITWFAEGYTWPFKPYFADEPTHIQRWLDKGDTRGSKFWVRQSDDALDDDGNLLVPVALRGKIEAYRKNVSTSGIASGISKYLYEIDVPSSLGLAGENIIQNFFQYLVFTLGGGIAIANTLKSFGAEAPGIRYVMEEYYKLGERIRGLDTPFTYNMRDEHG